MRATLLYDGDCGFCTSSARLAARIAGDVTVVPYQQADLDALGVTSQEAAEALQWVGPDGSVSAGAEAVARLLLAAGPIWSPFGRLLLLPGIRRIAARFYRVIATNRSRLHGGTPACRLD